MLNRRTFLGSMAGASAAAISAKGHRVVSACEQFERAKIADVRVIRLRDKNGSSKIRSFLEITTDCGIYGLSGELYQDTPRELEELRANLLRSMVGLPPSEPSLDTVWLWNTLFPDHSLSKFAEGVDPLTGKRIWGTRRQHRHTRTGTVMMGISAVDNAIWDLRGKLAGKPVCRTLGRKARSSSGVLSQTPSDDLMETARRARDYFDQGFTAQKWFLRHGPPDGEAGFRFNVGRGGNDSNGTGDRSHADVRFCRRWARAVRLGRSLCNSRRKSNRTISTILAGGAIFTGRNRILRPAAWRNRYLTRDGRTHLHAMEHPAFSRSETGGICTIGPGMVRRAF